MKLIITSIELKSPWHFFALSKMALGISNQLKKSGYLKFKKKGFWTKHYTMTLWQNDNEMRHFAHSGKHMEAVKNAGTIAREIRIVTISTDTLPEWKEAIALLNGADAASYRYD